MARRLVSQMVDDEAGNRLGTSGTEVRVYDDAALTTLSTLYAGSTGAATVTNPQTPNAGKQTTLTVAAAAGDTTITVADVTGFAVGHVASIYDGTNTANRTITAINAGTKVFTLDTAVGFAFTVAAALVGNDDMKGHIQFWLDDTTDKYVQTKDVASTRVLPPLGLPVRAPVSPFTAQDEGIAIATARSTLNVIGVGATIVDNPGQSRYDLTITGGQMMNEGANLTVRASVNFKGALVDAVDNAGALRTDVTIDDCAAVVLSRWGL